MVKEQTSNQPLTSELPIYNCHIHTFTYKNAPDNILNLQVGPFWGPVLRCLGPRMLATLITWWAKNFVRASEKESLLRQVAFLKTGSLDSQKLILEKIQKQYPKETNFVVLPMDMEYMELGPVQEPLEKQHSDLLQLAVASQGRVVPFYAADPRRKDLVQQIDENLVPGKFQGVKIYPNFGYAPNDPKLMDVYAICEERGYPVMAHCNKGGIYRYGLTKEERLKLGHPSQYGDILKKYRNLRLCLAHFGGNDEWDRQLTSLESLDNDPTWVSIIADMIRLGEYPNLYTDVSYTIFTLKPNNLYVDHFDYLKVMLSNQQMREHVLFGSDHYMVEQEAITERQISIALRSRLGEDLYFQIAYHNPRKYLGIK